MAWYLVTKRIGGRFYDYWQRTTRIGKKVKTENRYIGPNKSAHVGIGSAPIPISATSGPTYSTSAPHLPEDAMWKLNPLHNPDGVDLRKYEKARQREIWDWEGVKFGSVKSRLRRQAAAVRKAKRETAGIKRLNPFVAKVLVKHD